MQSIAARTVNEILKRNAVVLGITFHGGTSVVGYEWGAYTHIRHAGIRAESTEAPDHNALEEVSKVLANTAGIAYGPMTDTVYAVEGGLEDWAYTASWENTVNPTHPVTNCHAQTLGGYNITTYNNHSYRVAMLLVEMDDQKTPDESRLGETTVDIRTGSGLVPKFAQMCLAATDLVEPHFVIDHIRRYSNQSIAVRF
ncbi:MAG: M14 family zinc carboxypeptidase [Kangiellaceae bacterium]|jgi:hypothetical protein|nr:M14 family zinc carboxypeptidase [Kangiellaceae bacterium]